MKRILFAVALIALAAGCSPSEQPAPKPDPTPQKEEPVTPQQPQDQEPVTYAFTATPSTLNFRAEGETLSLELVTDAQWEATTAEDWLTLDPASGKGGATISITATENEDTDRHRRGTIKFRAVGENVKGEMEYIVNQAEAEPEEPDPQPSISVNVYVADATSITSTTASIRCNYSNAPSVGVYERGVYYGTSATVLDQNAGFGSSDKDNGYFTVSLSSLEPGTTYYYKAYVTAWDEALGKYVDFFSEVRSFTTESGGSTGGLQYLGGYEIPAIALANTTACNNSGAEKSGYGYRWYNYLTTNDNQMVVTHTYRYNGKQYRNYTCLVDKTKKAPLWTAFVMHDDAYPDKGAGRNDAWTDDPAVPSSWQQSGVSQPYSRGHLVASNYRQTNVDANHQTFYHTNQAPQYQTQFNDGVWNSLEQKVKASAPSGRDTLYVVVGLLYENNKTVDGIPLPSHYYKLLMKCSFNTSGAMTSAKGCAYIFTNEAHPKMNYSEGITSIDEIEKRSGWDFFANVPKNLQDTAEAQNKSVW